MMKNIYFGWYNKLLYVVPDGTNTTDFIMSINIMSLRGIVILIKISSLLYMCRRHNIFIATILE
jgi:hypothetical protein